LVGTLERGWSLTTPRPMTGSALAAARRVRRWSNQKNEITPRVVVHNLALLAAR